MAVTALYMSANPLLSRNLTGSILTVQSTPTTRCAAPGGAGLPTNRSDNAGYVRPVPMVVFRFPSRDNDPLWINQYLFWMNISL